MEQIIRGYWHKMKLRCEFCGHFNRKGVTYIVNSPEISGKFCGDIHAKAAWDEMKNAKKEGTI